MKSSINWPFCRLEKQYQDITKAEEKLHAIISKAEDHIRDVQAQEAAALKQSNEARYGTTKYKGLLPSKLSYIAHF